jgi:asparagine synthase (glutamine-hydrolysing)
LDERAVVQEFRELFGETVQMRTVSDVPVGVFLSGGIDSSAVTAFMASGTDRPVRTFSVGFSDEIDERPYARLVAERFRTQHTEILVEDRIEDIFQCVIEHFDEPFGDSSAIPTYLVSREARKHVKVVLTGDGGDELFAGYESYLDQRYQLSSKSGARLYRGARTLLGSLANSPWFESLYPHEVGDYAYDHWMWVRTIFTQQEIGELLGRNSMDVRSFFHSHRWVRFTGRDALSLAFEHDLNYYLPDDLLKKVDMASMMNGLECRAPFLDHRLIEFSMKIPPNRKLGNGQTKYLLRRSLEGILPDTILRRGKIGFGAPVTSWLRNQLREITGDLLASGCRTEGLIPRSAIDGVLDRFYKAPSSSDFRVAYRLWLLLVLEVWARRYA